LVGHIKSPDFLNVVGFSTCKFEVSSSEVLVSSTFPLTPSLTTFAVPFFLNDIIPEAARLLIQASAYGDSGSILVLDMGEPVKIIDLAENMIKLSGYEPGIDVKIEFSGISYSPYNISIKDKEPCDFFDTASIKILGISK
jgi:hypothetical protein